MMCLNGWGGKLFGELHQYIHAEQPDVLCLQEVVHTPTTREETLTYRDGRHVLPQRANLFSDICRALPKHTATFCPASQGVLWDDERSIPSQWGLATFVNPEFPVVAQFQGCVHKSFSPHGYGDHPRSRPAHVVRVFDYEQDRAVTVAHMHGLWHASGKKDIPERREQAYRFVQFIRSIVQPGDPLVVCGDFNVEPDSETFAILAELGLTDLVTGRGFTDTRTSHYEKPGRFADYLLVNDAVTVRAFDVVAWPEVSDHRPLVLEI
jgi:endonuclease/exonuclease/phosphatase family metal-dependent hydrolase